MSKIDHFESEVRGYCRHFTAVFDRAVGTELIDRDGQHHLDFLTGCGTLNYGHNNPTLKAALLDHIERDGLAMSLDMHSTTKAEFMETFQRKILTPRGLSYKMQFTGPTGTNAVEAAIKLARKQTGRTNVICFTNGFHGCTLGALAMTGNRHHRAGSAPLLSNVTRVPYENYRNTGVDSAGLLRQMIEDTSSGCDLPAAVVLECVQGEGGLNAASPEWMQAIEAIASDCGALLIVDDIQAGCGRTGRFFSFESLGIEPDIVCLAKSLSGFGLPMSLVLLKPEYDVWLPGEHNGTFRGNNHAFVTAKAAIDKFWSTIHFEKTVRKNADWFAGKLLSIAEDYRLKLKGRGLMLGLEYPNPTQTEAVQQDCIRNNLIVERCGPNDEVLKFLPPLNVSCADLGKAAEIVRWATADIMAQKAVPPQLTGELVS